MPLDIKINEPAYALFPEEDSMDTSTVASCPAGLRAVQLQRWPLWPRDPGGHGIVAALYGSGGPAVNSIGLLFSYYILFRTLLSIPVAGMCESGLCLTGLRC